MLDALSCFKALADETRLRLLHILWQHELNVNELVMILEMGQSRISRHLKILSSAGLLVSRREGLWVFYSVPGQGKAKAFLEAVSPFWALGEAFVADDVMAKTLIEERISKTQQFFNTIAEDWDKLSREVLGSFNLSAEVVAHMPQCKVAADLGCGTGNVLAAFLEKAETIIGVDGSPRMLELARRRFVDSQNRVSLRIGDMAHLPLRDGEADFACLNMVLHHLPAPLDALMEIHRVLQPQGVFVLTDFNRHEEERMRQDYGDRWLGFTEDMLRDLLGRASFSIEQHALIPVERNLSLHSFVAHPLVF